jgi:hypothetical protein
MPSRAELDDERSFLLRSIEDLEREHDEGDLAESDYVALRDRYTVRAAEVLRALQRTSDGQFSDADESQPTRFPPRRARHRRRWLAVAGTLTVLAGVVVAVVAAQTGSRLPGQTASGSVTLDQAQQLRRTLAQAEVLETSGDGAAALPLFDQVLTVDPNQPEALGESGWLEFQAGVAARNATVLSQAQQREQHAIRVAPSLYAPHLYLGSVLLTEGAAPAAVAQYRQFLGDKPPTAKVVAAEPFIVRAFTEAGEQVPSLPPAGASSSPSTPSP